METKQPQDSAGVKHDEQVSEDHGSSRREFLGHTGRVAAHPRPAQIRSRGRDEERHRGVHALPHLAPRGPNRYSIIRCDCEIGAGSKLWADLFGERPKAAMAGSKAKAACDSCLLEKSAARGCSHAFFPAAR